MRFVLVKDQVVMRKHLHMAIGFLLRDTSTQVTNSIKNDHTIPVHRVGRELSNITLASTEPGSSSSDSPFASPSLTMHWMDNSPSVKPAFNGTMREATDLSRWRSLDLRDEEDALSFVAGNSTLSAATNRSFTSEAKSWITEQPSTLNSPSHLYSPQSQANSGMELERLRMEQRREAELFAAREVKEKEKLKHVLAGPTHQYQRFAWDDIVSGSSSFAEEYKLGMGSYGTVYKCKLHHTTVAVKVLHSREGSQSKQFQQELEVLSRIRHPHLLLLLGANPEKGCLVYEFMENGSLEERLFRTNNTPPVAWHDRFRIAWEVASALAFLHNTKPKPIIHRDMKPANILLDQNLVSKIGDAGLCTMLNLDTSSMTMASRTLYKDTSPVGTLCYIDPEYQRTGQISTKSDVYALGMVILQLLTARPAVGIAHVMEDVINEGRLMQILDKSAGKWPVREATELALLGLQCAELRRKDRPDLKDKVLPVLERLKEIADEAKDDIVNGPVAPPSHFICPMLKDVMDAPCVASDGYTYDRKAIEMWLKENDTSPTTNFPLANKNLIPNFTLQYAITEWKGKRKSPRSSLRSM